MKEKIPFYNILNMFFVGAVFSSEIGLLFIDRLVEIDFSAPVVTFLQNWSVVVTAILIIVMFEIGFILNRASSIIIEPILTKWKIWPKKDYAIDVSEISKSNPTFKAMVAELVLTRTHILLYLIVGVLSLFSTYKLVSIPAALLIVIFLFSGKKHNTKINIIKARFAEERAQQENKKKEIENFLGYRGHPQVDET